MFKKTIQKLSKAQINKVAKLTTDGESMLGILYSQHKRHNPVIPMMKKIWDPSIKDKGISRKSVFDYIYDFAKKIIPEVENIVENRLLEKFKSKLTTDEKLLVDDAYRQRKIMSQPKEELQVLKPPEEKKGEPFIPLLRLEVVHSSKVGKGFSYHTVDDIGILLLLLLL